MRVPGLVALLVAIVLVAPTVVLAQRPDRRDARRVWRFERIVLVGDPHKPSVYYVLERASPTESVLELRRSFVPDLVRTVDRGPF